MDTTDTPGHWSLGALAARFELALAGPTGADGVVIAGLCALSPGRAGWLAFATAAAAPRAVAATGASALIVSDPLAGCCRVPALVAADPRLMFARIGRLFEPSRAPPGIHPSAIIAADAVIDPDAAIGAYACIGAASRIDADCVIGPATVLGDRVHIASGARIADRVSIGADTRIGARALIAPGAVIGARGFGLVYSASGWEPMPQVAGVMIGCDVEIGAASTIDRGALDDTRIEDGVKLDDQVHIGHNCRIGAHTVIAGCTGVAGSVTVGRHCMIGGGVGIGDHVTIADGVIITGASQVSKSLPAAGVYSSTLRAMPARAWRRALARLRRLDQFERRLAGLEARYRKTRPQDHRDL